jgi:hypothetical protein
VHWSKPDEPEAVRLIDFEDPGSVAADVMAFVPLRNGMLVWKEDGLFSVAGSPPTSWVFAQLDPSIRLLSPRCAVELDDVCYAWTDRGVVAATEAGVVEIISAPIGDRLRKLEPFLELNDSDGSVGVWMTTNERLGIVVLGVYTEGGGVSFSDRQFVWHARTRRWSTWALAARCMGDVGGALAYSPDVAAWHVLYQRVDEDDAASYRDVTLSGLTASITGGGLTVTIATSAFGAFTPVVGDVLVGVTSGTARITAIVTGGGNYTITVDAALAGATVTWHQQIAVIVQWNAQYMPGRCTRWFEWHAHMQLSNSAYLASPWQMSLGGNTSDRANSDTVTASVPTLAATSTAAQVVRVGPPRNLVRATELYPIIRVKEPGVMWAIAELDLHAVTPQSQRVVR